MPVVNVLGSAVFYRETGSGVPIVFVHGNPASSFVWRKVLPAVGPTWRCLAPDLIGMGESGKPDIDYTFDDHARYLDAWFDAVELDEVILVGHDWGCALAFDWAARHPERVRGVAFSEPVIKPMTWQDYSAGARELFQAIRTEGVGEAMVLDQNIFIEQLLPGSVTTGLSDPELAVYRGYYPTPASRRPLLQWARSQPVDGTPADVVERISAFDEWLATSTGVPKLMLTFDPTPTTSTTPELIDWCAATVAGLQIEKLGPAGHETPEDQPMEIAAAITSWATRHNLDS